MDSNPESLNAFKLMWVTDLGISIVFKLVQLANIYSVISVRLSERIAEGREVHSSTMLSPIEVTEEDNAIDCNELHMEKAEGRIVVTEFGIITPAKLLHP